MCLLDEQKNFQGKVCFCRYAQLNIKMSSHARPYDAVIPTFLQDRPHDFIKQCMDNMELANAIERKTVVLTEGSVETGANKKLLVDMEIPYCQCFVWCSEHIPCKHMFAIQQLYDDKLLTSYFNSPWFNIDKEFVPYPSSHKAFSTPHIEKEQNAVLEDLPATAAATETLTSSVKLPTRKKLKESTAAQLRANLRQLMNYSYLLPSTDHLQLIKTKVDELLTLL